MQTNLIRAEERYLRVRDSAAQILTAEQFARFDQAQRDRLEMLRANAELAGRRAALAAPAARGAASLPP
jgi:hypothetical protein